MNLRYFKLNGNLIITLGLTFAFIIPLLGKCQNKHFVLRDSYPFYKPLYDTTIKNCYPYSRQIDSAISLTRVNYECDLKIHKSILNRNTIFFQSTFNGITNFTTDIFKSYVSIKVSRFKSSLYFSGSHFCQNLEFTSDTCEYFFNFINTRVSGNSDFSRTRFEQQADFSKVVFNGSVYFKECSFSNLVNFNSAKFSNSVYLSHLELLDSSEFNFENSVLPDTIDFSDNKYLSNDIDLTVANFKDSLHYDFKKDSYLKPHYIFLYKSDVPKFHLDYTHFKLIVDSIPEKHEPIPVDEAESMYEALLNNFKQRGQQESYKLLDIEYQEFKWKHSWAPFMAIVDKGWWNYGYNKEKIFLWTFLLIVMFTIITFCNLGYLMNNVYDMPNIHMHDKIRTGKFTKSCKRFFRRAWYSFIYSANIFFRLTLNIEKVKYDKFWGVAYIMFMYTAGLICLAYMANFVLQN